MDNTTCVYVFIFSIIFINLHAYSLPDGYIGCYFVRSNANLDRLDKEQFDNNSAAICKVRCKTKSLKYTGTGIKDGRFCACFTDLSQFQKSNKCNSQCPGNSEEICGGNSHMSVYYTPSDDADDDTEVSTEHSLSSSSTSNTSYEITTLAQEKEDNSMIGAYIAMIAVLVFLVVFIAATGFLLLRKRQAKIKTQSCTTVSYAGANPLYNDEDCGPSQYTDINPENEYSEIQINGALDHAGDNVNKTRLSSTRSSTRPPRLDVAQDEYSEIQLDGENGKYKQRDSNEYQAIDLKHCDYRRSEDMYNNLVSNKGASMSSTYDQIGKGVGLTNSTCTVGSTYSCLPNPTAPCTVITPESDYNTLETWKHKKRTEEGNGKILEEGSIYDHAKAGVELNDRRNEMADAYCHINQASATKIDMRHRNILDLKTKRRNDSDEYEDTTGNTSHYFVLEAPTKDLQNPKSRQPTTGDSDVDDEQENHEYFILEKVNWQQ